MSIRLLPDQLASQIAAGEVVERPFSVIKELVENSIDAGATTITIDVREGGRELMQVADNGDGIAADEIELAFQRHATSKLASADDLESIKTLGFRGEALASIAAVSHMTVVSRAAGDPNGVRLVLEAGNLISRKTAGAPKGTVIAVENLFYNVPARLKFLKTVGTEKRLIDEFVTRYALAYPEIRFRLTQGNRVTLQTTGSGSVRDVLLAVYGPETTEQLIEITADAGDERPVKVWGFVSDPALNWSNRSNINLFVNGRWIRDNRLTYAVIQAYHTLLPVGRYPFGLIFIEMPPEEVDVNVHPTKVEVRFRDEGMMFGAVQRAVRSHLLDTEPTRDMGAWPAPRDNYQGPVSWSGTTTPAVSRHEDQPVQPGLDWSARPAASNETGESTTDLGDYPTEPPVRLPMMRVIGQVGAAYIIAEGPEGLYLIDQHAAHERILYEELLAEWQQRQVVSQGLVAGAAIYLSPSQSTLLEEYEGLLANLGFQIEAFGPNAVVLRAVPAILGKADPAQALLGVLADLESERQPIQAELEALVARRVCKSGAVKAGQTLSREEMEAMIRQLEVCETPHTCPHGRPTMIHLSAAQLARQFGRT
ncbi:MAG: DNA mismatch repair endonuclease MutL [Chloroflexota bacterium]